jgi:hypothetical protein
LRGYRFPARAVVPIVVFPRKVVRSPEPMPQTQLPFFPEGVTPMPLSSEDLTSRNLRCPQFQHQAQIRARENGLRRVELLAEFFDRTIGRGIGRMM